MKHPNKEIMMQVLKLGKKWHSVAAFVVKGDRIISKDYCHLNQCLRKGKLFVATKHAEINAIEKASEKLGEGLLNGCWLYSSLEPCPMCVTAAIWARMDGIVYCLLEEDRPKHERDKKSDWNWIHIKPKEIVRKAKMKPKLVVGFLRKEGQKINYWS